MSAKPIKIRSMITASPGNLLVACDLSQAESWIVAHLANEPRMIHALRYGDIHMQTAGDALFYGNVSCIHSWDRATQTCGICGSVVSPSMRYLGKRWNHASAYRMGPERATQVVNKDSDQPPYVTITIKTAKEFSVKWHGYYAIKGWWNDIEYRLQTQDRTLRTVYGRKRTFYGVLDDTLRKEATAYEPQSTVADHFNGAVHPELGIRGGLLAVYEDVVKPSDGSIMLTNQSHDSCLLDVPKADAVDVARQVVELIARPLVVNGMEFVIPVDAEIGERYGELERIAA